MTADIFTSPTTYTLLLILAAIGAAYAYGIVRRLRRRDPDHGQTALLVIIGTALTGTGTALILSLTTGLETGLAVLLLLLAVNIVTGAPIIAEYIDDHLERRTDQRSRDVLARLLREED